MNIQVYFYILFWSFLSHLFQAIQTIRIETQPPTLNPENFGPLLQLVHQMESSIILSFKLLTEDGKWEWEKLPLRCWCPRCHCICFCLFIFVGKREREMPIQMSYHLLRCWPDSGCFCMVNTGIQSLNGKWEMGILHNHE